MISPVSKGGPNIALLTIVCGWTFLVIAVAAFSLTLWAKEKRGGGVGYDDYPTVLALAATIALVSQTTWAIIIEAKDKHETELSKTMSALVVRVYLFSLRL